MHDPIVITGYGVLSALGNDHESTIQNLIIGNSGIGTIKFLSTAHTEFPVGEVKMSNSEMEHLLELPENSITTRSSLMGMIALDRAISMANLDKSNQDEMSIAFVSGTTVGGMDRSEQHYLDFLSGDSFKQYISTHDCGACTEMIARHRDIFDFVATPSTACSSAANSIILGANMLLSDQANIVVSGGCECLTKFHLNGFNSLMILDHNNCRPFDRDRAGLNLGEGAAYIVMEKLSNALARKVNPIVELAGWGNACDAYHQTASSENGEGSFRAMQQAINRANIKPEDVSYINAHGTGTPNNDLSETHAMQRLFGKKVPLVSSTKSSTGHTTSASGSIESVISIMAIKNNFIPANIGFSNPIENGITPVIKPITNYQVDYVLCNSFGFGGNDSSLLFKRL